MKKTIMIIAFILILLIAALYFLDFTPPKTEWGVTFSEQYAKDELGLDWQKTYLAILDDLKVDRIRLSAYWNHNEPHKDQYNFGDLDWQMNEANKRDVKIILAIGRKLPRWPECHDPGWVKSLTKTEIESQQIQFMTDVVNRYKSNKNLIAWQVENEPFLQLFGECPPLDEKFLQKEMALVRSLDSRPIMITDTGELNWWVKAAKTKADIIGTTLYRVVYNKNIGYFRHLFPPSFYTFRVWLVKTFFGANRVIVAELQAEAWHTDGKNLTDMELQDQFKSLSLEQFKKNVSFTKKAGFDEAYLWGAEWWYYLKEKRNSPDMWQEAKKLWQ